MIWMLQILVSVIFFANKVLIFADKKVGWLLGAIATVLASFYFYLIGLYVYTGLEFGLMVLMGYGYFKQEQKNPRVEVWIGSVTALVMLALGIFAWGGIITTIELVSSLALLAGAYLLTHEKIKTGWWIWVGAHTLAAYLGYHKGQQFFGDFQVASAIVSLLGALTKESRKALS